MNKTADNTVTLTCPIQRGKEFVDSVRITEAMSQPGCLRGLKLYDVLQTDVDSMFKLLPRVTEPALTEAELVLMSSHDFIALSTAAVLFLAPPSAR